MCCCRHHLRCDAVTSVLRARRLQGVRQAQPPRLTNDLNQTCPQVPTGKGFLRGRAPQKHHQSSTVTPRSGEAPEWSQGQDIVAQPGFASCCLAEGPAAPAPVGSAASPGAVWLHGRAGELLLKTQPAREVVGACGGISLLRSGGVLGDVVVPLAVTLGWELWLWDGWRSEGQQGEGRCSRALLSPWRRGREDVFAGS